MLLQIKGNDGKKKKRLIRVYADWVIRDKLLRRIRKISLSLV